MITRISTLVLAVGAIGLATGLAAAGAGSPRIEANQFTVPAMSTQIDKSAKCPGNQRALGGGVVQSGDADGLYVRDSGPLSGSGGVGGTDDGDAPKRWKATVASAVPAQRILRVFAICAPGATVKIQATSRDDVPSGEVRDGYANCPGSKRAVGGGVVSGNTDRLFVAASGPTDSSGFTANTDDGDKPKRFYAAVFNGSDQLRSFNIYAICSGSSKGRIEATEFQAAPSGIGEALARCENGEHAVGGGVTQIGLASSLLIHANGPLNGEGITLETNDGDRAKQWYAAVENTGVAERTLRVFAVCE